MNRALVVDDSNPSRISLHFSLSQRGFEVVSAEDGRKGLDEAEKYDEFAIIITDINMPKMDGFEMIQKIRQIPNHARTPIIALSADEAKGREAISKGATAFIIKSSKTSEEIKRFLDLYLKSDNG